ncbi:hypothetical protein ACJ8LB_23735 [Serratia sp. CY58181]|uniref:hypothetical protein n=1 Tax=Serratia TaxID=613 RepID=UPI0039807902
MTLTTERQKFAEQNEMSMEFVNWFFDEKKEGCGNAWFIMAAAMWEGWKGRLNREAQPVQVTDEMALAFHRALNDGGIGEADLEEIKVGLRGALCNITAPPALAYPERLPCPVHLLPGLKFGKGVPTRSMLDALVRRAEYEAELEAMTPEQKAEDDARIEAFKALLPRPPAPAVPEKCPERVRFLMNMHTDDLFSDADAQEIWNACRAAMLAQPVSSGYKLVPAEPTEDMIAAAMNCDDVSFNADETFCVNFGNIYAAMLAAAPGES